jgi:hypothetical protein
MMRIGVIVLSMILLANPVFAKNHKKLTIECVPSPNPDVPPCDLDQTPVMPSEIAKKLKAESNKKEDAETVSTPEKKPSAPRSDKGGY